jgi:membrane associated rhomboid family serine protease
MMILPLGDENADRRTTPFVNYLLIALNILVFVVFQGLGANEGFTLAYSTVPQEIITNEDVVTPPTTVRDPATGQRVTIPGLEPTPIPVWLTLITSMFMHGSILHIAGNMLYLWIFGDNLEDALGHGRYLLFYLICGVLAGLAHVLVTVMFGGEGGTLIPSLGASGAISGVLGGYLLMFPGRRVTVLMFRIITQVSALVAIGLWFVFQLLSGLSDLGGEGGVAYGAHIGGFIAGFLLVKLFAIGRPSPAPHRRTTWS